MKCPNCSETLVMTDRNGVEIDYCPKCRGVWLDRGELDKIIERSAEYKPEKKDSDYDKKHHDSDYDKRRHDSDYDRRKYEEQKYKGKKRDSFLGDLFDF